MIDTRAALASVVRHATELEDDYDDIEPTLTALAGSGDTTLVPGLRQALATFLDEKNGYGRDLIAGILAGIQGADALPVLLRAAARPLGDDQDSLSGEIIGLLAADPVRARAAVTGCTGSADPQLRRVGLWALDHLGEAAGAGIVPAVSRDPDPRSHEPGRGAPGAR